MDEAGGAADDAKKILWLVLWCNKGHKIRINRAKDNEFLMFMHILMLKHHEGES